MEELSVTTSTDLINGGWVEIDEEGAGHIFAIAGLGEESLERATSIGDVLCVGVRATISSEAMLEEVPEDVSTTASRLWWG